MVTILGEDQPGRDEPQQPWQRGRGCRGGRGRGGRGGRGGCGMGRGGFGKMLKNFLGDVNVDEIFKCQEGDNKEDMPEWLTNLKDQFTNFQTEWKNNKEHNPWKNKRATLISKHEDVIEVNPD
jgi:hypothetical protein